MVVYPAIFHKSVEGGYVVVFPDFDYGATEGKSLEKQWKWLRIILVLGCMMTL